jgi:hypothetical protein
VVNMSNDGKIADILHLEWGFIQNGSLPAWANRALYRSAVIAEGLIYFFGV